MAASHTTQKLQNEFLSCPRCSNLFKDPKALPCLHNFCKACLQLHIDEQMAGDRHTSFTCPTCSKKIFVPDPSKATNTWAKQFPSNFVIKGMLDAIKTGSPVTATPPGADGNRHPLHKTGASDGSPSSRHRERLGQMGQSRADSGGGSIDLESNPEVGEAWKKVMELKASLKAEESGIMISLTKLTRQRDDQEKSMTAAVAKLQEIIAMRKTILLENLSSCFSDEVEKLRQRMQSCKDHLQSLRSCQDTLQSVGSQIGTNDSAFDLLESVNVQLEEVQYRPTQENPAQVVLDYDAMSVYKVTEALASFGTVRVEKESSKQSGSQAGSDGASFDSGDGVPGSSPPRLVEKISMSQTPKDGKAVQVYDITVTKGGFLVMTMYGDKCVQAYTPQRLVGGVKTRKLLGRVELDTQPRCLCSLSDSYVAVVGDTCVYLIAVLPGGLEIKRTIPTGKNYTGIAAYGDNTLVASCQNPVCVDFVGLNGFINETIDKDRVSGTMLFKTPLFLATSGRDGLLFVTDDTKMLCVNNAGKVKYEYPKDGEHLSNAQGVCVDASGFVYLVDRGKRSVQALSARGTRIADIITQEHGLTDPCAIALDEQGLLYVTNDFMEILVFQVC